MGYAGKIKDFFKKYGVIALTCHICLSLIFLILIFLLLTYGIDLQAVLLRIGIDLYKYGWFKTAGKLGIVIGINQILAPVRYTILLFVVPLIGRKVGNQEEEKVETNTTPMKDKTE